MRIITKYTQRTAVSFHCKQDIKRDYFVLLAFRRDNFTIFRLFMKLYINEYFAIILDKINLIKT